MRRGGRRLPGLIAALGLAAATPAPAAERGIDWLLEEPVSLFDLGMFRLRQDMAAVAHWLAESGYAADNAWSGAFYQWRERHVIAYVTFHERLTDPTEARCRETFRRIAARLTEGLPEGTRRAELYLEDLFLHQGFGNWGRPRTIGKELVELIRFEVTLLPPPPVHAGGRRINCGGRLDEDASEIAVSAMN